MKNWYMLADEITGEIRVDFYDRSLLLVFENEQDALDYVSNWDIQGAEVKPIEVNYGQ